MLEGVQKFHNQAVELTRLIRPLFKDVTASWDIYRAAMKKYEAAMEMLDMAARGMVMFEDWEDARKERLKGLGNGNNARSGADGG